MTDWSNGFRCFDRPEFGIYCVTRRLVRGSGTELVLRVIKPIKILNKLPKLTSKCN